jgi:hypothetical protein
VKAAPLGRPRPTGEQLLRDDSSFAPRANFAMRKEHLRHLHLGTGGAHPLGHLRRRPDGVMHSLVKRMFRRLAPLAFLESEGEDGIAKLGHRGYVGYMWEEIGTLQFDFLVSTGLRPDSYLLDIACSSLRLGAKPFRTLTLTTIWESKRRAR